LKTAHPCCARNVDDESMDIAGRSSEIKEDFESAESHGNQGEDKVRGRCDKAPPNPSKRFRQKQLLKKAGRLRTLIESAGVKFAKPEQLTAFSNR